MFEPDKSFLNVFPEMMKIPGNNFEEYFFWGNCRTFLGYFCVEKWSFALSWDGISSHSCEFIFIRRYFICIPILYIFLPWNLSDGGCIKIAPISANPCNTTQTFCSVKSCECAAGEPQGVFSLGVRVTRHFHDSELISFPSEFFCSLLRFLSADAVKQSHLFGIIAAGPWSDDKLRTL